MRLEDIRAACAAGDKETMRRAFRAIMEEDWPALDPGEAVVIVDALPRLCGALAGDDEWLPRALAERLRVPPGSTYGEAASRTLGEDRDARVRRVRAAMGLRLARAE